MLGMEDKEHIEHYAKHFLALTCYAQPPENLGSNWVFLSFSGFILSVRGEWYFATAGHIFEKDMPKWLAVGYAFHDWQLKDMTPSFDPRIQDIDGPGIIHTIPFALESQPKWHVYNEISGTDFAVFPLRSYYRNLLKGLIPLDETAWQVDPSANFEKYLLLGIPSDTVKLLEVPPTSQIGAVSSYYVSIEVEPLTSNETEVHLLRGHIPDIAMSGLPGFEHIHGMSGGPIFGLRQNPAGESRYWLLAIQSTWNPGEQIITGYRIQPIVRVINGLIESQAL